MLNLKTPPDSDIFSLFFFSIFGLKIRVLDEVYDYLSLYFTVVFPA